MILSKTVKFVWNAYEKWQRYCQNKTRVPPLFQHWFSMTKKMKIHYLSAQQLFQSWWYTTYECIAELVVTVPAARQKDKTTCLFTDIYKYHNSPTRVHSLFFSSCSFCKNYMTLWSLSMTFHDFPGLENGLPKFHDFPWPGVPCKTDVFSSENVTKIAIKILQRSAVTQNALGGLFIYRLFANFL